MAWGVRVELDALNVEENNYSNFIGELSGFSSVNEAQCVLVDARKVVRRVSLSQIYSVLQNSGCYFHPDKRIAVISSPESDEIGSDFIAEVFCRHGMPLSFFSNESDALRWLLEPESEFV